MKKFLKITPYWEEKLLWNTFGKTDTTCKQVNFLRQNPPLY